MHCCRPFPFSYRARRRNCRRPDEFSTFFCNQQTPSVQGISITRSLMCSQIFTCKKEARDVEVQSFQDNRDRYLLVNTLQMTIKTQHIPDLQFFIEVLYSTRADFCSEMTSCSSLWPVPSDFSKWEPLSANRKREKQNTCAEFHQENNFPNKVCGGKAYLYYGACQ